MVKIKRELAVGEKVRGYGLLNEYGEFEFIPEETGSRQGQVKLLTTNENYTISTTKTKVIVHIRFEKCSGFELIKRFLTISNNIMCILREYEF